MKYEELRIEAPSDMEHVHTFGPKVYTLTVPDDVVTTEFEANGSVTIKGTITGKREEVEAYVNWLRDSLLGWKPKE